MPPRAHPHLYNLPLLEIGASSVPGVDRIIPLANNENTEAPSGRVREAVSEAVLRGNFYPEVEYSGLRDAVSTAYGVRRDRIAFGNGSSELIALLTEAYCGPGDEVVIGQHGYLYFAICVELANATVVYAPPNRSENQLRFDPASALAKVSDKTKIVFLDNPSNPLGTYIDKDALRAFRQALREDILLVLDAAYADYADADDFDVGDDLVRQLDNTVVLRTFSKIYGLAGFRVGWVHGPANVIEVLNRMIRPGDFSSVAAAAAQAALEDVETTTLRKTRNTAVRNAFAAKLENELGFSVLPSQTNFLFTTPPASAPLDGTALHAALQKRGILVRKMGAYGLGESVRISIGTEEEMDIAFAAIAELERQ